MTNLNPKPFKWGYKRTIWKIEETDFEYHTYGDFHYVPYFKTNEVFKLQNAVGKKVVTSWP